MMPQETAKVAPSVDRTLETSASGVNRQGRQHVFDRDSVSALNLFYGTTGAEETAERHNIAQCNIAARTPAPGLSQVAGNQGDPFLGPVKCDYQNAGILNQERAMQQAAYQVRYGDMVQPRTWSAAGIPLPDLGNSPSRMMSVVSYAQPMTSVNPAALSRGGSATNDPVLSRVTGVGPRRNIAAEYLALVGDTSNLTPSFVRENFGPMSTMPIGALNSADIAVLRSHGVGGRQ